MNITRRAFLLVSGSALMSPRRAPNASARLWVVDEALPHSRVLRANRARVTVLCSDIGLLWHERLSKETSIGGVTRFADAFVFAQLGADLGMRARRHCEWEEGAVLWTLERG